MFKRYFHILFTVAALGVSSAALAQWQWIDDGGRKVYSDTPPPAHVPATRILKSPSGAKSKTAAPKPAATADAAAPDNKDGTTTAGAASAAEQEQAKQQAEHNRKNAEIEKKNAEIERQNRAALCNSARIRLEQVSSGRRLSAVDGQGNVGFMDDAQREAEKKRAQNDIRQNC